MSNDRYISVISLGRNRSFDNDPVLHQVLIGLGRNRFIVLYRYLPISEIYRALDMARDPCEVVCFSTCGGGVRKYLTPGRESGETF